MKEIEINIDPIRIVSRNIHWLILLSIVYLGIHVRLSTLSSPIMLDYDPWWYYRHTEYLLDHDFQQPSWDILSYFPPGRPIVDPFGWQYMVGLSYKIFSMFFSMDFMRFAMWSPAIMAGLIAIPAYFTEKIITNRWGGLATAFFSVLIPTLIGVSMAGYMDTDALVVFFSFASVSSLLYALKKY